MNDVNRQMLELVVDGLGDLRDDVVFLGGAIVGLLVSSAAAEPVRETRDVDCVVEVGASRRGYQLVEQRLFDAGWTPGSMVDPDDPLCRYRRGDLVVDVMPTDPAVLGFASQWAAKAFDMSRLHAIGRWQVRVVSPPLFAVMKIEAFRNRGAGDYLSSHDLEDLVLLVDGRPELTKEVAETADHLRQHLAHEIRAMWPRLTSETLPGVLLGDTAKMAIVEERLAKIRDSD